jgi:hypothetical protein
MFFSISANTVTAIIRVNIFGRFGVPCIDLTVGDASEVNP